MNLYIKNHEEIRKIKGVRKDAGGVSVQHEVPVDVQLDMYDNAHGLAHDAAARLEYYNKFYPGKAGKVLQDEAARQEAEKQA